MNLSALLADVYRRCGYSASPASDVTTRITAFLNETQQEIFSEPGMSSLLNDQITFDSVASQAEYALPQTVQKIKVMRDVANRQPILPMSMPTYRLRYPAPATDIGTPCYYVPMGMSEMFMQGSLANGAQQQFTVISTSASDTGTAYIEGFRASTGASVNRIPFAASVTMTGTSLANIGGSDVERITKFWISAAAVGEVRLRNAAVDIVSRIVVGQTVPHYATLALAPTPASALTYSVDYERTLTDLTVSTDEPLLPVQFHRMLAIGARMKEYEKQDQMQRYTAANADFIKAKRQLKHWVHMQLVGSPNMRSGVSHGEVDSAVNVATS